MLPLAFKQTRHALLRKHPKRYGAALIISLPATFICLFMIHLFIGMMSV